MGFTLRVDGHRNLGSVRQALRNVGDKGLSQQMSRGLQRAAKPIKPEVEKKAVALMPSGYGPLLSKSIRVRTAIRASRGSASVTIRVYGDGKQEHRDVARINKGVLRHPVWGRRRKPWVNQSVRRGFVDRPVDGLLPDAAREMQAVVDYVADQITRG